MDEQLANDPFAFTTDVKLVEDLRTCLKSIAFNLSADAYAKLKTVTFSEFQNVVLPDSSLLGPRDSKKSQPRKMPRREHFKEGKKSTCKERDT